MCSAENALHTGLRQLLAQHGEPLIQPCLHGAQGAIQEVGNLLERETVVLLQDDGGPLIVWKHGHRPGDRPAQPTVTLDMIETAPSYEARADLVRGFVRQDREKAAMVVRQLVERGE